MSLNADMIGLAAVAAELLFIVLYTKRGWKVGFARQLSSLIALLAASGSLLMILKVYSGLKEGDVKGLASGIALFVVIAVVYSVLRLFLFSIRLASKLPVINLVDSALGVAAGFVCGLLILYIVESLSPFFLGVEMELVTKGVPAAAGLVESLIQTDIDNQLNSHKTLETDKKLTVKDGDQINLDYVGKIDGKAFEGGSTDGAGADLTIGSGSYIDNFEEQLIGSHPGDKVTVKVTFPEDYQSEDLAGKEAEFDCTVNGIYSVPEFNDKFVEENLADFAEGYKNTAEEYRRYLTDTKFDQNLESALKTYISDNVKANSYPKEYLQRTKEITRYMDEQYYAQMVSLYQQMGYPNPYADFYAYAEAKDDVDYERVLEAKAKDTVRDDMAYQLFYQNAGLTISDDDYSAYLESTGMTEETNGKGYIMQQLMHDKVIDDLKTKVGTKTVPAEDAAAAATGATAAAAE